ncbi:hypothetical protein BAE44_0023606 [Dichanthelium oligosanthes]|uniref:Uncharacterized protein n=1 Tax=Dichanthelium oligosanthes TaxID=888268 RepID=A0A1E5URE6_9POAL|nr:hypothetical protein BAE44_0023606 [Dichanthelium oligosanthes]
MAQRESEMLKHGRARTKVAGDDEMLRTGFHNGTPLEAGKIADSQPVDLFAPAHRLANDDAPSSKQQQQQQQTRPHHHQEAADEGNDDGRVIAESEPVDLLASARGVAAEANNDNNNSADRATAQQGMAEHAAGGRRLGRQA